MPEFETATVLVRNFVSSSATSFRASDPRERVDNFATEAPEIRVLLLASGHVRGVSGIRENTAEILLSSD